MILLKMQLKSIVIRILLQQRKLNIVKYNTQKGTALKIFIKIRILNNL